jgi:hypothetical protein
MNSGVTTRELVLGNAQAEIHRQLTVQGYATVLEDDLTVSTSQWRAIAHDCADVLGRPLKTSAVLDRLYAVVLDWPGPGEQSTYPPEAPLAKTGNDFLRVLTGLRENTGRPRGRPPRSRN